jgi:uncharacterized protein YodC (DUF2158 family)
MEVGEMLDIKLGDVVQLKSGGPLMTVRHISDVKTGEKSASCVWFVGNEVKEMLFGLETLVKPEEPGKDVVSG